MDELKLRNESGLEFKDISSEEWRIYNFSNGQELVLIPRYLHVSDSGGHRILDDLGISYYIQPKEGWYIKWKAKAGEPHFVK